MPPPPLPPVPPNVCILTNPPEPDVPESIASNPSMLYCWTSIILPPKSPFVSLIISLLASTVLLDPAA